MYLQFRFKNIYSNRMYTCTYLLIPLCSNFLVSTQIMKKLFPCTTPLCMRVHKAVYFILKWQYILELAIFYSIQKTHSLSVMKVTAIRIIIYLDDANHREMAHWCSPHANVRRITQVEQTKCTRTINPHRPRCELQNPGQTSDVQNVK